MRAENKIPMTAATRINPSTHTPMQPGHSRDLAKGPSGAVEEGEPRAPWTRWDPPGQAEPLSPLERRVGTVGLFRTAFGCCYFGGGRGGGLLFVLYLTCSPLLAPPAVCPLSSSLCFFFCLFPPLLSLWPSATSVNCYICTIYTRQNF